MLTELTQKDIEYVVAEVLYRLNEMERIPVELVTGELIGRSIIHEGLITTYSATSFRNLLKKVVPLSKYSEISFHVNKTRKGSEQIYLTIGDVDKEIVEKIVKYLGTYGWFISMVKLNGGWEKYEEQKLDKNFSIVAEPKYDVEITDLPDCLYHISPAKVEKKIGVKGLNPKSFGKVGNHPERIYLFTEYPDDWENIAKKWREDFGESSMVYNLYRISTKNLKIPFYNDQNSNFISAVYTTEPIPYFAIEKIGEC